MAQPLEDLTILDFVDTVRRQKERFLLHFSNIHWLQENTESEVSRILKKEILVSMVHQNTKV